MSIAKERQEKEDNNDSGSNFRLSCTNYYKVKNYFSFELHTQRE